MFFFSFSGIVVGSRRSRWKLLAGDGRVIVSRMIKVYDFSDETYGSATWAFQSVAISLSQHRRGSNWLRGFWVSENFKHRNSCNGISFIIVNFNVITSRPSPNIISFIFCISTEQSRIIRIFNFNRFFARARCHNCFLIPRQTKSL